MKQTFRFSETKTLYKKKRAISTLSLYTGTAFLQRIFKDFLKIFNYLSIKCLQTQTTKNFKASLPGQAWGVLNPPSSFVPVGTTKDRLAD